jgi:transcriptional regulator with XRE-family HTH domain
MVDKNAENLSGALGKKIKQAREKAGLTQLQVAEKASLNVNYYAQVERGAVNTTLETLEKITKALGLRSLI